MGATLQTLDGILKNQYLAPLREQVNNDVVVLDLLDKDQDSVVGKNFTIPLHVGGNEGFASVAEGGILPTAGSQQYKECIVPQRYIYSTIEITGPTIKATKSDAGAFIRAVDSEMKGAAKDFKRQLNRMFWGDGTGILSVCGTTTTATTVNVASTKYIRVGMTVDILTSATGAVVANGVAVLSVPSSTTFTVASAVSTASTDAVYIHGSRNIEVMGLQGICSATLPIQTLDPATYAFWKANVLANGGTPRAITEALMQTAMDTTETNSDGSTKAILTSFGVRRAYQSLLTNTRQYMNTMDLKGGKKALDYNGLSLIADKDAPTGKVFFLDTDYLKVYQLSDIDWMQEDGAILSRVAGKDAYGATLYRYLELGCSARNAQTVLADITEA
ncbi:phage major capsid protein [Desulfitobacterium metallireducens]|uniref:2,3-dihydro-2,3-dihydroxybenzoate dehydrogenase n=1 Tax=Desulfitobacterium metallireducens DSM 15288 TaxID=871968 RepID=W0EDC1_9FIRM|nr:phage major capsid protein [Desulfitobacterium metallireducens]AHF07169.1 2,3-dihydro-2,3-dihydroxybenzoate dehydrogenase [Desulfitobacterium metallireducens DSM 15288]